MSSPQPKGTEISSGSLVVSEINSAAAKSQQKAGMRRKKTQLSPFKVPDSNIVFLQSINEKEDRREEMRKYLALPIDEKTTHAVRMMTEMKNELVGELKEEEEAAVGKEKMKMRTVLPQTGKGDLKTAARKRENMTQDSKHDLIFMEREKAVMELSLMKKRSEILRMDKAVAKETRQLKELEKIIETDNLNFEKFLRENEKKSVEARTLFEQEAKSKQEKNLEIKKLAAEVGTIKSEVAKFEEILTDYKTYKELLFKLSPPEWQEAQRTKASKANVLSDKDSQEQNPIRNGASCAVHCKSYPPGCVTSLQDEPELYFTDPQQLLNLMTELTDQNLSLIQNSTKVQEVLEELKQSMETTRKEIEKDEEQIKAQMTDMNQRISEEKTRSAKLEQKVQFHVSLNSADQDVMWDDLSEKVAEVHRSCVDDRVANLSILEKLANIERRLSLLLQALENIPEDKLELMRKIKDSERRSRQREEKLREQREKQKERMRRYLERSLADSKKINVRKLMPRCMPVTQKVKVSNVDTIPAEEEFNEYLFGSEDAE
ncbi:cilia- and flagella-associated protein 100 [Parambassis ranga]|uniref:Cilia- and flagella-associated protein 100 n=1 Tax=Parambassis ranga TaxID=210632 RepID=A0A6P7J6U0_9TELE|nr:cilia- and flagella-associated protein 100-like [Parambassis ranga]